MSNFDITIGNETNVHQNPVVYSHGEPAVPASGNLTINLDPPQYGSVVGFTRWTSGKDVYAIAICEVVVLGTTVVGENVLDKYTLVESVDAPVKLLASSLHSLSSLYYLISS